jgi:hypothetical protein
MSSAIRAATGNFVVHVAAAVVAGFVVNLLWDSWRAGTLKIPGIRNPYAGPVPGLSYKRDFLGHVVLDPYKKPGPALPRAS